MFEEDGYGDTETQAGVQPEVLENGVSSDSKRPNKLLDSAYQSYKSGLYTDVTVVVGKQKFPSHRLVLASLSDYFPPLLKFDERDSEVTLHGVEPGDFSVLLNYAYTSEVDVTKENVQSLLIAADYLSVNHVKHICERFMADNLDSDNVCDVLIFAMNYSLLWLDASSVLFFLKENLDLVSQTDGFFNLDQKFLTEFFEDDNLVLYNNKSILKSVEREKLILTAVLRYLSGRPRVDSKIEAMIRSVRLCEMPKDLVKKCLGDFKDLKKNVVVAKYVKMREEAAKYLHERQKDLSFSSNTSEEIKCVPDSWFRHRKLTSSAI